MAKGVLKGIDVPVLPMKQPTFVLTLPRDVYKSRDDGRVELTMLLPVAKIFAEGMMNACLEMEKELRAKCG